MIGIRTKAEVETEATICIYAISNSRKFVQFNMNAEQLRIESDRIN